MSSFPTRNRKFQKNSKQIQKIRKYHHSFFSSENTLGKATKEKKYKKSFRCVPGRLVIEILKKQQKNSKKLENTSIASFQAKIEWEKGRERDKIIKIVEMCSLPTRNRKLNKNTKKIQKIRKHHHSFISSRNRMGKAEKETK